MSVESLSYSEHLWNSFTEVAQHAFQGQGSITKLANFTKAKAQLDANYAKQLAKISKANFGSGEIEGGTCQVALQQFQELNSLIAQNFEIGAAKTLEQVHKPLAKLKSKIDELTTNVVRRGKAIEVEYRTAMKALRKAKENCQTLCDQYQAAKQSTSLAEKAKRNVAGRDPAHAKTLQNHYDKAKKKMLSLCREAVEADKHYMLQVRNVRGLRERYDISITNVMHEFETLELKRISNLAAVMKHYMSVQSKLSSSIQSSNEATSAVMEHITPSVDIRVFVSSNMTTDERPPLPEYEKPKGHPIGDGTITSTADPPEDMKEDEGEEEDDVDRDSADTSSNDSFVYVEEDGNSHRPRTRTASRVDAETSDERKTAQRSRAEALVSEYLRRVLTTPITIPKSKYDEQFRGKSLQELETMVTSDWETAVGREAFAAVLNQARNTNNSLQLSPTSFQTLGEIICSFLDAALKAMHVRPAQLVMIMSQTFFCNTPEANSKGDGVVQDEKLPGDMSADIGPRVYLQQEIKHHPIWKEIRFWTEAFFDSYSNELKKTKQLEKWHSEIEQVEALHRQRNVLFAQLGAFAHNMTEFSMDPRETRKFIIRMCDMNEMEKEHIDMLLHMPCLQVDKP